MLPPPISQSPYSILENPAVKNLKRSRAKMIGIVNDPNTNDHEKVALYAQELQGYLNKMKKVRRLSSQPTPVEIRNPQSYTSKTSYTEETNNSDEEINDETWDRLEAAATPKRLLTSRSKNAKSFKEEIDRDYEDQPSWKPRSQEISSGNRNREILKPRSSQFTIGEMANNYNTATDQRKVKDILSNLERDGYYSQETGILKGSKGTVNPSVLKKILEHKVNPRKYPEASGSRKQQELFNEILLDSGIEKKKTLKSRGKKSSPAFKGKSGLWNVV
jgi:hypothetical protein